MAGPEGITVSAEIGGRTFSINTGRYAKQSAGSTWVRYGDTLVMVNANREGKPKPDANFLPLTVNYEEKLFGSGRIPGSFFRREGRPTEKETLTARIVDRAIRPLFDEGWAHETQVIAGVYSFDQENEPDAIALTGASAALCISDIAYRVPIAGVRIGRLDGKLIVNPTIEEREKGDLDLFVAASRDAIVMVEGGAEEVSEEVMVEALELGKSSCLPLIEMQEELMKKVGKEKLPVVAGPENGEIKKTVRDYAWDKLKEAFSVDEKHARYAALDEVKQAVLAHFAEQIGEEKWPELEGVYKEAFSEAKYEYPREMALKEKRRIGGRGPADIRDIWCEVGVLPRVHGSSVFTRGETQALCTVTLGTGQDEQRVEGLTGMHFKNFMLHYAFPPYSVGEVRRFMGVGRREVGHGALAERAVRNAVPDKGEGFPYTVRVTSDVTESNGSSSMATVCGATLALMDAGVPIAAPVAGIAMGLIMKGDDYVVLSDILGDEDHLGDMDFKVCGTEKGITSIQMDIKCPGLTQQIMSEALTQAKEGRLHILGEMKKSLEGPRTELSQWAPRITTIKIKAEKIKDIIGPGGKIIRDITARTGSQIEIEDSGNVHIASANAASVEAAIKLIKELTQEPEINKVYLGTVRRIMDFGAFVEIIPGTDGLVHISELADKRVEKVTDVLNEGDEVLVKVLSIDRQGKIRLSRKAALADTAAGDGGGDKPEGEKAETATEA
jgi:polyribonucleotide nucleotidyltransferase